MRALLTSVETSYAIGAGFFVMNSSGTVTDYPINRIPAGRGWSWIDFEFTCSAGTGEIRPWLQIDAGGNFGAGLVSYYELTDVTDLRYADAKVSDEAAARASQDSALASRSSALESRAGSLESRVSTSEGTLADVKNKVATAWSEKTVSVPGAAATVRLIATDANGNPTSQVALLADQIAQVHKVNGAAIPALTVEGGNVMIANDLRGGAGRVIFDNGSVMKVMGTGFGSSNQFIEWFGPRKASLTDCTEANATYYLKTDGSSYFGGSLSAGTIKNAIDTTSTASNASVTTGDVGSRGGTRTVVLSYAWNWIQSVNKPQDAGSGTNLSAQVVLSRNGTDVATLSASGRWDRDAAYSSDEPGNYTESIGGSLTFTDNSGGSSVSYSARLTVRNTGPGPQNGSTRAGVASQRISIVQTEQ